MTLVDRTSPSRGPSRVPTRRRPRPLWCHALALAGLLLVLLGAVGTSATYSADEGAVLLQARSLATGDGWIVEHPFPEADPTGERYPLELSAWGERGVAPYAKHPLYPLLLAGAHKLGGVPGMFVTSVTGTVAAAFAAALLARRLRPGTERATLWAVGVGSPLLFSSFWLIAHSLAAALAAGAVLAALRASESGRCRWVLLQSALLAMGLALRTEVAFVALGMAVAAGHQAVRRRDAVCALSALGAVGAVGGVRLAERWATDRIVGAPRARPGFATDSGSWLAERWDGLLETWLRPDAAQATGATALLLVAVLLAGVAVWQLHRPSPDLSLVRLAAGGACALVVARSVLLPVQAIPGLLVAFPLLWIGMAAGGGSSYRTPTGRALATVAAVAALGVAATQYGEGGSAEWGGRYFAVLLPLVVPLAMAGLMAAGERLDAPTRRMVAAALITGTLALSLLSVREVRAGHELADGAVDAVERATAVLSDPIVVSTDRGMPRTAWRTFDEQRWLLVDAQADDRVVRDLAAAGVSRFVLVSRELDRDLQALGALHVVADAPRTSGVAVVEIEPERAP